MSILNKKHPVILVGNPKLEGKPLITPLMDQNQNPKTDLMGNELGSMRFDQKATSFTGSFVNSRNRVAFVTGTVDQLQAIINENNLKEGSVLPGKITVTESLFPFWDGQESKMNPQTTEAIGITIGDTFHEVFMRMQYTEDMNAPDKFIRTVADVTGELNAIAAAKQNAKTATDMASVPGDK